jgi:hypothetical protein
MAKNAPKTILSVPSELGVLGGLARVNFRVRVLQVTGKFAQIAKTFNYSNAKATKKD